MATIDQLTTAAVAALNGHDFGVTFTAFENFDPRIERSSMGDGWHVWIVASAMPGARTTRQRIRAEPTFDIGLIRRLQSKSADVVNPCLAFADAVQAFVHSAMKELAGHDLISADFDPLWSDAHMSQQSVFFSVLPCVYRRQTP